MTWTVFGPIRLGPHDGLSILRRPDDRSRDAHCDTDGRLGRQTSFGTTSVSRWICVDCRKSFSVGDAISAGVGDHVRDTVVRMGLKQGVAALGCDERTALRHLQEWSEAREDDIPGFRPRTLGLVTFRNLGCERIVILDADAPGVVDIARDADAARKWISTRPGKVREIVVDVDPAALAVATETLAGVPIVVAPRRARRAIETEAVATARSHIRIRSGRRNFQEDFRLVAVGDGDVDEMKLEEIRVFWDPVLRALRRHVLDLIEMLGKNPSVFLRAVESALSFLRDHMPDSRLARLLAFWGPAFGAGAGEEWLDSVWSRIATFRSILGSEHARTSFHVLRAMFVFPLRGRNEEGCVPLDQSFFEEVSTRTMPTSMR